MSPPDVYDLIVVGSGPAGVSLAMEASRSGLEAVLLLTPAEEVMPAPFPALRGVNMGRAEVDAIRRAGDGRLSVVAGDDSYRAAVVAVDLSGELGDETPPWEVPAGIEDRIHTRVGFDAEDHDVLVVGSGESAAGALQELVASRARVVLCFTGRLDDVSRLSRQLLEEMEREQQATILWRTAPTALIDLEGFPMAVFADRRTPDLQFDHVVWVKGRERLPDYLARAGEHDGLYAITEASGGKATDRLAPAGAWRAIRAKHFPHLPDLTPGPSVAQHPRRRELARGHYNATITAFDTAHNELWRIRVKPDHTGIAHRAGQYCSLGLGFWEPRADDAEDPGLDARREKMVRRSYSISSPIFDEHGYLVDHAEMDDVELYIVWVRPANGNVPALTPRLALKHVGDRIYLGPKVAGRYSLAPVVDPSCAVVFCATGTGESPHNAMIVELLRKGHHGPILSSVSVRYRSDLAYLDEHRRLEERYPNYSYLAVPTREPDVPKRYMQDLLEDGLLADQLGEVLDPEHTHVFLCGNPSMIGLPETEGDDLRFPEPTGMVELLHRRGFTIDRRGSVGNVHYEEYW